MKIISIQDIIDCNRLINEKNLPFKIHLRDACGKQSCYIEILETQTTNLNILYEILEDFFKTKNMSLEYDLDKINFWPS